MPAKMNCAFACPCTAALWYHSAALTKSWGKPWPARYIPPSLNWASGFPASASFNNIAALSSVFGVGVCSPQPNGTISRVTNISVHNGFMGVLRRSCTAHLETATPPGTLLTALEPPVAVRVLPCMFCPCDRTPGAIRCYLVEKGIDGSYV